MRNVESYREFLPAEDEARVFGRLRRRILGTLLRQMFSHSRFRLTLVVVLVSVLWGGLFWMFVNGFHFLQDRIQQHDTYSLAMGRMFAWVFLGLMAMILFSTSIFLYGALFRSRDIPFLLSTPARASRVFLHKFYEAILLSSWGFVVLGSPILLAFGIVGEAPWYYYAMLPLFLGAFLYIPVAVGGILCMLIVRYLPGRLLAALVTGAAGLLLAGGWMAWSVLTGPRGDLGTPDWFQDMLGRLGIADVRLLPSWWFSTAILDMVKEDWSESVMFLAVMVANALFFRQLAILTAERHYRAAFSGLCGLARRRKRPRLMLFDRAMARALRPLPVVARLMTMKDIRLFRRDPMRWLQMMIFVVFLAIYFFAIRPFTYSVASASWVNMVSFLNLAVVGLMLSTFTTRFIFPTISLEGRRFWILGQLGVRRDSILWAKFWFAVTGTVIPCCGLVLLSDLVLRISWPIVVGHQLTCLALCLGLSGIAVGFGAWLPNLRAESPSQIAAGFGGTLTLVTSTLYIVCMVVMTALPTHFYLAARLEGKVRMFDSMPALRSWIFWGVVAGAVASALLGAAATLIPLRIGLRAFRKMEF